MRSLIVVTSWWSNCLGLTCLSRLKAMAPEREIRVAQAGKSEEQMERFRRFLPNGIGEIPYPSDLPSDDSVMREYLAKVVFRDQAGVWFFDHDTFIQSPAGAWFDGADARFADSRICLCTRFPHPGEGITQPAYWLSPARWPEGLSSFDPVPFSPKPYASRPDLHRHDGRLVLPGKDTLVQVREELDARGLAGTIAEEEGGRTDALIPPFPPHAHLGGIHLYTGPATPPPGMPSPFFRWRRKTLERFESFFRSCPPEWLEIEEPELLRRHVATIRAAADQENGDAVSPAPYPCQTPPSRST